MAIRPESKGIDVFGILKKRMLVDGFEIVLDLEKSKGAHMVDKRTGDVYLDMMSFFASMPVGINHPDLFEPEFQKRLMRAAVTKVSNSDFYTEEMAFFVDTFDRIAIPPWFHYAFFISGGALAVENALKTAFDWKVRKNFKKGYKEEKGHQVMHFREAFHGRTGYTLSLTNTADPRKYMYFPRFDWPRIDNPKIIHPLEKHLDQVIEAEKKAVAQMEEAFAQRKDDIAAIIIEPIQGEGGDNHFRYEFFKELRRLADEHEAMLVYDEVQTGIGLTGKMWAHEWWPDAKPDIIAFGKKMQVCGILVSDRVDEVENNVFHESSRINSTWGGNLVDMVRSAKYLEIIKKYDLVENARKQGGFLLKRMTEIQEKYPEVISNVRGLGMFAAFDLPSPEIRDQFRAELFKKKILILATGRNGIRFRPFLDISTEDLEKGLNIIEETAKEFSSK